MAVQLGQAYIAIHADGAALAGEVRAQMEAAMAEASAMGAGAAGAAGEGAAAGTAGVAAAADEATASMQRLGAEAAAVAGEVDVSAAEMDAAMAKLVATEDKIAAGYGKVAASADAAGAEASVAMDKAAASAGRVTAATDTAARSSGLFGMSWAKIGEAAGAIGIYEAIKSAGNFQQQLTRLVTSANEVPGNLATVSKGILDMGSQVGFSANQMTSGMYLVESAGYHGAQGLAVLKASAEIARQENASLDTTTQAVTTTMRDYGYQSGQSAEVASKLNEAVAFGKTNLQDFSSALHSVEPNAAAAHIKLEDVLGSLATMTNSGMSAQQAAQNLAHTLSNFEKPTQPMINALSQVGLNANDLTAQLGDKGVSGTLIEVSKAIKDHMGPSGMVAVNALNQNKVAAQALVTMMDTMPPAVAELSNGLLDGSVSIKDYRSHVRDLGGQAGDMGMQFLSLYQSSDGFNSILKQGGPAVQTYLGYLAKSTGTVDALRTALLLTSDGGDKVTTAIKGIADVVPQADGNVAKWRDTQATFNQQFDNAKAAVENFGTELGMKALPILTQFFGWIVSNGVPGLKTFGDWLGKLANSAPVQAAWGALQGIFKGVLAVLQFIGPIIGTITSAFGKMPAPIQTVIIGLLGLKAILSLDLFGKMAASSSTVVSGIGRIGAAATGMGATYKEAMAGTVAATETLDAPLQTTQAKIETLSAEGSAALDRLAAAYGVVDEAETVTVTHTQALAAAFESVMPRATAAVEVAATGMTAAWGRVREAQQMAQAQAMEANFAQMDHAAMLFPTIARTAPQATGAMAGLGGAAKQAAAEVGTGLGKALGGITSMLGGPLGIALIGATTLFSIVSGAAERQKEAIRDNTAALSGMYQTIASGGPGTQAALQGVVDKQKALNDARRDEAAAQDALNNVADENSLSSLQGALGNAQDKVHGLEKAFNDANGALDPLQKAQVAYMLAVQQSGPTSQAAANAAGEVRNQLDQQRTAQELLNKATQTGMQQEQDQAQKTLDAANAQLAAKTAADQWTQTLDNYNESVKKGFKNDTERALAEDQVAQAMLSTASAAGQAAAANATVAGATDTTHAKNVGLLDSLVTLAKSMGDHVPAAIQNQIDALQKSDGATAVAASLVDNFNNQVHATPDGKTVTITAPTDKQVQDLKNLGFTVEQVPGSKDVKVVANTEDAAAALAAFTARHWTTTIVGTVQINYSAAGDTIFGSVGKNAQLRAFGAIDVAPMAEGGFIDNRMAQVVGPQTYRLVGDRMQGDEAFIPLDGAPRSRALWAEAGRRMGMGEGGGKQVHVTYAPSYALPAQASAEQVGAIVSANLVRDFHLGLGDGSLGFSGGN